MTTPRRRLRWSWRSQSLRSLAWQVAALLVVLGVGAYLLHNTLENMRSRGIRSGFDFLLQPAGFAISEGVVGFESGETYAKAFVVGLTNTLRVALAGVVLATVLGTLVGIARLARNALLRGLAACYVEAFRNVPLLLQLFMWYFALTELLPPVDAALRPLPHVYLSKNGLQFPVPEWAPAHLGLLAGALIGAMGAWLWVRHVRRCRDATGSAPPAVVPALAAVLAGSAAGWFVAGAPSAFDLPEVTPLTVVGGGTLSPEFLTVLVGLSLYTASYIAEIVRAGLQAVPRGQHEAAVALGLSRRQELRQVLLPQALRVIVPPLTSQYLNLTKNSSLAVAVGYPDVVSIATTTLNQTGRAVEAIALVMLVYLTLSLATAAIMSLYNRRVAIRER